MIDSETIIRRLSSRFTNDEYREKLNFITRNIRCGRIRSDYSTPNHTDKEKERLTKEILPVKIYI